MSDGWDEYQAQRPTPMGPAVTTPNRPRSPQPHPGWLSRCLLWAALLINFVPTLVTTPMLMSGSTAMFTVIELVNIASGILSMLLGAVAMILVRETTWARRLIAGGIFVFVGLYTLIVVPLMATALVGAGPGREPTALYGIVLAVQSTVLLALTFTAWNTVRRRRWWTVFISFAVAGLISGGTAALQALLPSSGLPVAGTYILVQVLPMALTFAGLGLFHLLGRIPSVIVPLPVPWPRFGGSVGYAPNEQAHQPVGYSTGHAQPTQYGDHPAQHSNGNWTSGPYESPPGPDTGIDANQSARNRWQPPHQPPHQPPRH